MPNTKSNYQAFIKFEELFSEELQLKLQKLIWNADVDKRNDVWIKNNIPYDDIEKFFIDIVKQRNNYSKTQGFNSFIEFKCHQLNIPFLQFKKLYKRTKKSLQSCNKLLGTKKPKGKDFYSEFGNHCFLCEIDNFPFHNLDEVAKSTNQDFKMISIVNDDMSFVDSGNHKNNIHLDGSQNLRHSTIDLIHEIFHLQTRESEGIKNKYISEKKVLVRELEFYKTNYPAIYTAFFGELLKVFHRVLFEIELYKNPNQDLAKLYARIFNKCYDGKYQKQNRTYLLDTLIIRYPFQNLPHMLAQIDVLSSKEFKKLKD